MKHLFAPIVFSVSLATAANAEYSARDFLSQAPAATFYTEDNLTEDQKRSVLQSTAPPSPTFTCEAWGIATQSPTSLTLQICPDAFVRIQLFRERSGDSIVAVESNRSSGRAVELVFFKVVGNTQRISKLSNRELTNLGLEEVTENDLLTDQMKFPVGTAERLSLGLDEAGRPTALVMTWMNPRWEKRTQTFNVVFEWNGSHFKKKIEKRI